MVFFRSIGLLLCAVALVAASKVPSAYDGSRSSFVYDGKQNYPLTLFGVAVGWEKGCLKGKAADCMKLGDAFSSGLGDLNREPRGAIGYWLLACAKGAAEGCSKAAQAIEAGTTNYPANPTLAMQTAEKGCLLKDASSCASTALHYYRGDVVSTDRTRAITLWDTGCAAKSEDACRMKAGALYYDGGDAASQAEAVKLYRAGCDRKQGWGCSGYAQALATGSGVGKDEAQAYAVAEKGCLQGSGDTVLACAVYARYLGRSGKPSDAARASQLLTNACLAGIAEACNDAGLMGERDPPGSKLADWEIARSFRDGCDLGHGPSCGNLARLYMDGSDVIKVSMQRAIPLYDKGCALGDAASCKTLEGLGSLADKQRAIKLAIDPAAPAEVQIAQASQFAKSGRGQEALEAVARLMEEAVPEAEWLLGGWIYYGYPGVWDTPNRSDGFILMENAARQGHHEALKWVAMAYWEGDGVAVDQNKALGYMGYAAQRGDDPMAEAIWRSMKMEPVRQANARRAKEAAEAAERRKNDFWANFASAAASWSSSSSSYSSSSYSSSAAASASWQRYQAQADQSNWNNYISYMSGGTTACPISNPYC